jgi:hypothetical protein
VERSLPAFSGSNAAFWIEIKEDIIPAFGSQPVAERDCSGMVLTRESRVLLMRSGGISSYYECFAGLR